MAAWPRNVVKEHRCAAWLLYLFLISLFITYASFTINHNLQRRDEPLVVEDVVEEAWTLPEIVVCLGTDGTYAVGEPRCAPDAISSGFESIEIGGQRCRRERRHRARGGHKPSFADSIITCSYLPGEFSSPSKKLRALDDSGVGAAAAAAAVGVAGAS